MPEQDTTEAPEATEDTTTTAEAPEAGGEGELDPIPEKDAWDPERALTKIRKLNAEVSKAKQKLAEAERKSAGADEYQQRIKALEASLLRERVGRRLGLPDALIDRLRGDTEDDLLADAEQLVSLVSTPKPPPTRRPSEDLRGGGQPDKEPEETDVRKIAERMFRH